MQKSRICHASGGWHLAVAAISLDASLRWQDKSETFWTILSLRWHDKNGDFFLSSKAGMQIGSFLDSSV